MNNKEKLSLQLLAQWFEATARVLPWRETRTPYQVWISEIMLQQTQVATVIPYFNRWMDSFPTVKALAEASLEEVYLHWAGLGYYQRARNLHAGAKQIVRDGWPQSKDEWLAIPGVGPYTAGAIASIALNHAEPIVDGNVERVFARVYLLSRSRSSCSSQREVGAQSERQAEAKYKERLWSLAGEWVHLAHKIEIPPYILNQALMELGATVCKPKVPSCDRCPLSARCGAFGEQRQSQYPEPKRKPKIVRIQETRFLITDPARRQVLVVRAGAGSWRSGLWDLPGQEDLMKLGKSFARFAQIPHFAPEDEIHSKHVVTHHRIMRTSRIVIANGKIPQISEPEVTGLLEPRWMAIDEKGKQGNSVALGSPAKKVLSLFCERIANCPPRVRVLLMSVFAWLC